MSDDRAAVATVGDVLASAVVAYEALVGTAEPIAEEWQYVSDLAAAWRARFDSVLSTRRDEAVPASVVLAVQSASAETARLTDPHRAIDWLSTYPQIVLLALGERP
ncbi:MAG TPA: hypothetical protein VFI28_03495 [Candidatus Limnocylindrales bacterium]|nr:hypothetical protein [Candidatus Limnocylindrales bacterium]